MAKTTRPAIKPTKDAAGAKVGKESAGLQSYFDHHKEMAKDSWGRLLTSPLGSLMTWMVIAIALALPSGMYVVLSNIQSISAGWDGAAQVSLYLEMNVGDSQARKLVNRLQQMPAIEEVEYISREKALQEFKSISGFGDVLNYLDDNPLPNVITIKPGLSQRNIDQADALLEELRAMPGVEKAKLDLQWVKRMFSVIDLLERGIIALGFLLALAVLLVIGNTIRLAIENRREEIIIVKLVGGTDAFVRRPFLYTGVWYGLGGGVLAWILVQMTLFWLDGPVNRLAGLYYSQFHLSGLGFGSTLLLLAIAMVLGWLGAWLAVKRHLSSIEPT